MKIKPLIIIWLLLPLNLFGLNWRTSGLYRSQWREYRSSLFNHQNLAVEQLDLSQTNHYFSQYFSTHTRLFSFDWQLDVLGTVTYEGDWDSNLRIKQFYLQRGFFQNLDILVGRALLRWGTGYAFNPTDIIAPPKELSDPDNTEKRSSGNDLIKLEYFGESYSLALCYLNQLDFNKKMTSDNSKWAVRFYKNFAGIDLSLVSLAQPHQTPVWGGNLAYVIGERLEIHGEITTQKGSFQPYHRALVDVIQFYRSEPFQPLKQNSTQSFNQYLIGFQYTLPGNISWILEYYHRDQGYSSAEWQRMIEHTQFLVDNLQTPYQELAQGNLLWNLNVFSPKGAQRDYLMNYLNLPLLNSVELKTTTLLNLSDFSLVEIGEIDFTVKKYFTLYGRSIIFTGDNESEFGAFFQSFSIEGGLKFNL